MKYGYFDNDNREYVITTYDTPLPWINYLTNGNMFSLISNTGGGYSYYKDAKLRRITRFQYNSPSRDGGGRLFYIDDGKDVFSPCYMPARTKLDSYECRVGLNYTSFHSEKNGLAMSLACFIPLEDNVEINRLELTNETDKEKTILLYGGAEFCLWDALDDMTNFQRNFSTGEVGVHGNVIYHKTEYRERRDHFAFFSVNHDIGSFETSRDRFVGLHGDYVLPKEIKEGKLSGTVSGGWSPIAMEQVKLVLKPGESKTIVFLLGYFENPRDHKFNPDGTINRSGAELLVQRYSDVGEVDNALSRLKEHWVSLLSGFRIDTRDQKLDTMVNIWNQYQCMMTYHVSRSASYFESGIGRGIGFRDSCQDILGFVHLKPELARERILDIASIMLEDGSAYHQFQPLNKEGNSAIGGGFNDDPLWLIGATYSYIAETGDKAILNQIVRYSSGDDEKGTLLEHLDKAFWRVATHLGPHSLPLIGHADWNDCLNLNCFSDVPGESFQCHYGQDNGMAESVFIAGMFVKYGKEYADILHFVKRDNGHVLSEIAKMESSVYRYGYDKDHFLRAYDAFGHKVGSDENEEGKIYIEPQGMCVMAGLGLDNGLARKALDSVYSRLNTEYGICLLSPCYSSYHIELGEISSYPKGYKENGGIFCHNNPWIIIAECLDGNVSRAFEYYRETAPSYIEDKSDVHRTEPYVYSQMVAGRESPAFGEAKNSWLTGTAAWSFVAVSQYYLGIRPTLDGLLIDPVTEDEMDIERHYRGKRIHIHLKEGKHDSVILSNEDLANGKEDIYVEL